MSLEPVYHNRVRIVDIDGTVIKKTTNDDFFSIDAQVLPDALEIINEWFEQGDYIVFWTARPECYRDLTQTMLDRAGFEYHELICGKPYSHEIHIYDDNLIISHQVKRDVGLIEIVEE